MQQEQMKQVLRLGTSIALAAAATPAMRNRSRNNSDQPPNTVGLLELARDAVVYASD